MSEMIQLPSIIGVLGESQATGSFPSSQLQEVVDRLGQLKSSDDGLWLVSEQDCYEWSSHSLDCLADFLQHNLQNHDVLLRATVEVLAILDSFIQRSAFQPRKLFLTVVDQLLKPLGNVSFALQRLDDIQRGQLTWPDYPNKIENRDVTPISSNSFSSSSRQVLGRSADLLKSCLTWGLFAAEEHILGLHSLVKHFLPPTNASESSGPGTHILRCWDSSIQCEVCSSTPRRSKLSYHIKLFQSIHNLIQGHEEKTSPQHTVNNPKYSNFLPVLYESLWERIRDGRQPGRNSPGRHRSRPSDGSHPKRPQKMSIIEDRLLTAVYHSFQSEVTRHQTDLRAVAGSTETIHKASKKTKRASPQSAAPKAAPLLSDFSGLLSDAACQLQVQNRLMRLMQTTGLYHPNHDTPDQTIPYQIGQSFRKIVSEVLCPLIQVTLQGNFVKMDPPLSCAKGTLFAASAIFGTIHSCITLSPHLVHQKDPRKPGFNSIGLKFGANNLHSSIIEASWLLLWLCSDIRDQVTDSDRSAEVEIPKTGTKRKASAASLDSDHQIDLDPVWQCVSVPESSYFTTLFDTYGAIGRLEVVLEDFNRALVRLSDITREAKRARTLQARLPWMSGPQPKPQLELVRTFHPGLRPGLESKSPLLDALDEHVTPTSVASIWNTLLDAVMQSPAWPLLSNMSGNPEPDISVLVWIRSHLPVFCQIMGHWMSRVAIFEHNVSDLIPLFRRTTEVADVIRRTCVTVVPDLSTAFFSLQVTIQSFERRCARFSHNPYLRSDNLDTLDYLSWDTLQPVWIRAIGDIERGAMSNPVSADPAWNFVWSLQQLLWQRLQQIHSLSFLNSPKKEGKKLVTALLQDLPLCLKCGCSSTSTRRSLFPFYRNWKLALIADDVSVWRPYCGSKNLRRLAVLLCSSRCERSLAGCHSDPTRLFQTYSKGGNPAELKLGASLTLLHDLDLVRTHGISRSTTELAEDEIFVKAFLAAMFECGPPLLWSLSQEIKATLGTLSELLWKLARDDAPAADINRIVADLLNSDTEDWIPDPQNRQTKDEELLTKGSALNHLTALCDRFSHLPIHAALDCPREHSSKGQRSRTDKARLLCIQLWIQIAEVQLTSQLQQPEHRDIILGSRLQIRNALLRLLAGLGPDSTVEFLLTSGWVVSLLSPDHGSQAHQFGVSPTSLALDFLYAWGKRECRLVMDDSKSNKRIQLCDLLCDRARSQPNDSLTRLSQATVLNGMLHYLETLDGEYRVAGRLKTVEDQRSKRKFTIPKIIWRYFLIMDEWFSEAVSRSDGLPQTDQFTCSRPVLRFRSLLLSRFCAGLEPSTDRVQKLRSIGQSPHTLGHVAAVLSYPTSAPAECQAGLMYFEDFIKCSINLPLLLQLSGGNRSHQSKESQLLLQVGSSLLECALSTSPFRSRAKGQQLSWDRLLFLRVTRIMTPFYEILSPADLGHLFRQCVSKILGLQMYSTVNAPSNRTSEQGGSVDTWRQLFALTHALRSMLEAYSRRAHEKSGPSKGRSQKKKGSNPSAPLSSDITFRDREVRLLLDALLCVQSHLLCSIPTIHRPEHWLRDQIHRCIFNVISTVLGKRHAFQLPAAGINQLLSLALSSIDSRFDLQHSGDPFQEAPSLDFSRGRGSGGETQDEMASGLTGAMTKFMGLARSVYAVIKYRPAVLSGVLPTLVRLLRMLISTVCCQSGPITPSSMPASLDTDSDGEEPSELHFGSPMLRHVEVSPQVFVPVYPRKYQGSDAACLIRADFLSRILEELTKPSHKLLVCKYTPQILAEFISESNTQRVCDRVCQDRLLPGIFSTLRMCEHAKQTESLQALLASDEVSLMTFAKLSEQWKRWGKYKGV